MNDIKYTYVVSMWPTVLNQTGYTDRHDSGEILQLTFPSVTAAALHAVENGWWPFMVERVPSGGSVQLAKNSTGKDQK